jgi:hypothetical protein
MSISSQTETGKNETICEETGKETEKRKKQINREEKINKNTRKETNIGKGKVVPVLNELSTTP